MVGANAASSLHACGLRKTYATRGQKSIWQQVHLEKPLYRCLCITGKQASVAWLPSLTILGTDDASSH